MAEIQFDFDSGKTHQPARILLYGPPGIGKSVWASKAPNPVFLDIEKGSSHVVVNRFKLPKGTDWSWDILLQAIRHLETAKHEYETAVIDTLDRAEWLCWEELLAHGGKGGAPVKRINDVGGGYGNGYAAAYEEFRKLWAALERLRDRRGMNVIVLGHAKTERVNNLNGPDWSRHTLKVHEKVAGMAVEAADTVLYADYDVLVTKDSKDNVIATGGENRVLHAVEHPTFRAKNRYFITEEFPLSWDEFAVRVARGYLPNLLIQTIIDRAKRFAPGILARVQSSVAKSDGDVDQLARILASINKHVDGDGKTHPKGSEPTNGVAQDETRSQES